MTAVDGKQGNEPERRQGDRRSGLDRRQGERRKGDRRTPDRIARQLAEEYLQETGNTLRRTQVLVDRHWTGIDPGKKTSLVQALTVVFEEIEQSPGHAVTDEHRSRCQELITMWLAG